jgi:hypothetical protein
MNEQYGLSLINKAKPIEWLNLVYLFFSFYFCLLCLFLQYFFVLFLRCRIFLRFMSSCFLVFFSKSDSLAWKDSCGWMVVTGASVPFEHLWSLIQSSIRLKSWVISGVMEHMSPFSITGYVVSILSSGNVRCTQSIKWGVFYRIVLSLRRFCEGLGKYFHSRILLA